jgi:hypothetical protein
LFFIYFSMLGISNLDAAINNPKPIEAKTILKFEEIGSIVKSIHPLDEDTVFLLCQRDMVIHLFQPSTGALELLTSRGQGPDQLSVGFFGGGVVDNRLIVYSIGRREFVSIYPSFGERLGKNPFNIFNLTEIGSSSESMPCHQT